MSKDHPDGVECECIGAQCATCSRHLVPEVNTGWEQGVDSCDQCTLKLAWARIAAMHTLLIDLMTVIGKWDQSPPEAVEHPWYDSPEGDAVYFGMFDIYKRAYEAINNDDIGRGIRSEINALRKLAEYADHRIDCVQRDWDYLGKATCKCGLDAAWKALNKVKS